MSAGLTGPMSRAVAGSILGAGGAAPVDMSWVLPGATVDMDFQNSRFYGGTLASLMNGAHTAAIGALLAALQNPAVWIVLALKATGTAPSGTTWISTDTFLQIFGALSDTTVRSRKGGSILNFTLGSGAFSTTPSKLGFTADATGRWVVGNNGSVGNDVQSWAAVASTTFVNVDSQWNRLTVGTSLLTPTALAALTV